VCDLETSRMRLALGCCSREEEEEEEEEGGGLAM
jgi:hypothetical protein